MFASDRPYAVQMLYMGFPGTMGADFIDYLVTDQSTSPASLAWVYHEKLLWMPHSYFCNDHRQSYNGAHCRVLPPEEISTHFLTAANHPDHPPLAPYAWYQQMGHGGMLGQREQLRLKHELPPFALIFCCFNQLYKLEPSIFSCWCAAPRPAAARMPTPCHSTPSAPPDRAIPPITACPSTHRSARHSAHQHARHKRAPSRPKRPFPP